MFCGKRFFVLWDLTLKEEHLERFVVWEGTVSDLYFTNPPKPCDW